MKCKSCETQINPKMTHAIEQNMCPFCGESILDEELKNLLSSLNNIMLSLSSYPEQLEDWLLSNYNFIKTDSPTLIDYVPEKLKTKVEEPKRSVVKIKTDKGEEEVIVEKTQSEETTNEFFKRADVIKPKIDGFNSIAEKTKYLKNLAQQIKKSGSPIVTANDMQEMISPEVLDNVNQEDVMEMSQMLDGGSVASALATPDYEEEIPSAVLAMASKAKNKGSSSAVDLLRLQQMQDRVKNSRSNFEDGANRGKNGFSRSG